MDHYQEIEKGEGMLKIFFYVCLFFLTAAHTQEIKKVTKMKEACTREMKGACYELGVLYENGWKVEQNVTMAMDYYRKACDLDYDDACDRLEKLLTAISAK